MKRLTLLILFSGLISFYSKAQLLTGIIRDSVDNTPLNKAAVILDYEKRSRGTYTDAEGKFSLFLSPGPHVLIVRYVGYLPYRITIEGGQNLVSRVNTFTAEQVKRIRYVIENCPERMAWQ